MQAISSGRKPATIHDVARAAGVSIGTVSKALNERGHLTAEVRERVKLAAGRLNFRPNALAQSLHRQRSFTVGLITTDSFGRFSLPLLEGIENALDPQRVAVFVCKPTDDPDHERQHVESLLAKRVDGLIVTARRTDPRRPVDRLGSSLPIVYAYAQPDSDLDACLLPDDEGGGRLAGEHLIALGRDRIAHITGPERFAAVQERRRGFVGALRASGRDLPSEHDLSGPWSEAWGHDAAGRLLASRAPFDAIFCGSDQIARGVADRLREAGVRVPQDVALVGYDNWDILAAATRPALTTVDPCLRELGQAAALKLLGMIEGIAPPGARRHRHPCRLVVRDSCGGTPSEQAAASAAE